MASGVMGLLRHEPGLAVPGEAAVASPGGAPTTPLPPLGARLAATPAGCGPFGCARGGIRRQRVLCDETAARPQLAPAAG